MTTDDLYWVARKRTSSTFGARRQCSFGGLVLSNKSLNRSQGTEVTGTRRDPDNRSVGPGVAQTAFHARETSMERLEKLRDGAFSGQTRPEPQLSRLNIPLLHQRRPAFGPKAVHRMVSRRLRRDDVGIRHVTILCL